jgi:hypothetical protein
LGFPQDATKSGEKTCLVLGRAIFRGQGLARSTLLEILFKLEDALHELGRLAIAVPKLGLGAGLGLRLAMRRAHGGSSLQ